MFGFRFLFVMEKLREQRRALLRGLLVSFQFAFFTLCWMSPCVANASEFDSQTIQFFETDIRPLLADHCFQCHSARSDKLKGGLRLDNREAMIHGGDSGPSLVPGQPDESMLMEAVRYQGLEMPPDRKLSDKDIAKLEKWIRLGAPFPGGDESETADEREFEITEEDRAYWAYQPISKPTLAKPTLTKPTLTKPTLAAADDHAWNQHPIDKLIFAKLREKKLTPNESATPRQLLRRLYFDLIGLPPTAEQISMFERNPSQEHFAEIIDHLLSLPQYGERWGRHWLDVVRYAQSNGYERDDEKPLVWRYRDYVVKAFNDDKPFDRFVKEQLAGDELADADAESVTATGFYRLGVWDDEPDDKRAAEFDGLDDMLSTIGQVFLGQTLGCARCHDHMFDPIAQRDYYELLSFLRNVKYYEQPKYTLTSATYAPLAAPDEVAAHSEKAKQRIAELETQREGLAEAERKKIENEIQKLREGSSAFEEWTLAIREHGNTPKETHLLIRGDAGTPGDLVEPRFLSVLGNRSVLEPQPRFPFSCGLRTQLADWIASPDNPLTARVIANRIWQHHFGRAIARTPNDLGKAGIPPTHPELINWLAADLIENDWSIKSLHKQILLSRTWQMSSAWYEEKAAVDPANDLFWRQNMRRLDAESIRDSMLFVAGNLNLKMGGRGFFPNLSSEVLAAQSRPGWGWGVSDASERNRRSVYIFTKRGVRDPLIETFDYVNTTSPLGVRPVTTVAPQALVLLNGRFIQRQALELAKRVTGGVGSLPRTSIDRLYRLTLGRSATDQELEVAANYLSEQQAQLDNVESVVTFRPDVPDALHTGFRSLLAPESYVMGPRDSWSYHPGKWVGGYESIDALDLDRVPFMLWQGTDFASGSVRGKIMLHNATRFGSLLLGGINEAAETAKKKAPPLFTGIEIRLDPGAQRVIAYGHSAEKLDERASVETSLTTSAWINFRLERQDSQVRMWLGEIAETDRPLLEFPIQPLNAADRSKQRLGVAVHRGAVSLDEFVVESKQREFDVANYKTKRHSTSLKAMQSLCVVLMNTNEFLYVD